MKPLMATTNNMNGPYPIRFCRVDRRLAKARCLLPLFSATLTVCAGVHSAFAQQADDEEIPEIVVTAERRVANLETTPLAITVVGAAALAKLGDTDLAGIANASTSINFTPYPSSGNTLTLYMRGQGVADANQITQDGSIGLYEDGFYIARPQAANFDLADVDRVEILRGPQGTLYGRNTTGGAINIIGNKPSGEADAKFSVDGGNRDYFRALGVIDAPSVLGVSSKLTLLFADIAGNVRNSGGEDFNKTREAGGRIALHWDDAAISGDYFGELGETDSTPLYYQDAALAGELPGYPATDGLADRTWEPIPLPLSVARFTAEGLTLSLKLGESATLRSLTGFRTLNSSFGQNYSGAFGNPATAGFIGVTNYATRDVVGSHEFTEELQLVGDLGERLNYVAGFYYFHENAEHVEDATTGIPLVAPGAPFYFPFNESDQRDVVASARSTALYLQETWNISEPLALTLGARETFDARNAARDLDDRQTITALVPPVGAVTVPLAPVLDVASNSRNFDKFNPAATLNMAWSADLNTYLRIATGYKAGGSSESSPPGQFNQTVAPENVTTYELGLKSYEWQRRARLNVALFHSEFKNMQLQFQSDPANLSIEQAYNAGAAKIDGAELEMLVTPIHAATFGINYTFLRSSIESVTAVAGTIFDPAVNPLSPYHVGENISTIFRLPYAPNGILDLTADFKLVESARGDLDAFLNYRNQGREFLTATTGPAVPGAAQFYSIAPYGTLDGRLTWHFNLADSTKTASVSLWGKNITNERYPADVVGQGAVIPLCTATAVGSGSCVPGSTVAPAGYTYQAVAWAPKAMYGVQFRYGF